MINKLAIAVCTVVLALVACGSDDDTIDLGIEDSKQIKELDASELEQICKTGLTEAKKRFGGTVCAMQGLMAEMQGQGNCEDLRSKCMNDMFDAETCEMDGDANVECDVTIGELEACINDTLAALNGKIPTITCSTSLEELQKMENMEIDFEPAASCDVLDECEGLNIGIGVSETEQEEATEEVE